MDATLLLPPLVVKHSYRACQSGGDARAELTRGEGIDGAEAAIEFGIGQAALAIKSAEKVLGADHPFRRIAFHASGDEVAVGIAPRANAGHDMVEAPHARGELAETIKAGAAFAGMNGLA